MKILIYGAGVIGSVYGWQLSKAGCDITVLARKGQKEKLQGGIHIVCRDFRGGAKNYTDILFRPSVIDGLLPDNDFDYIIVSTNRLQLPGVLPFLKTSAGKANIVFFLNIWDSFDQICEYLTPEQYFFGFPFMAGGGREETDIHCTISGLKYSHTPLGEIDGRITSRVENFAKALENAQLRPVISKQISVWLITHYAVAAGLSAGILSAGCAANFVKDSDAIRTALLAIREGFQICRKRGIDAKSEKANRLYRLPLFISIPVAKKIYGNEALQRMFDGHVAHAPAEIGQMIDDLTASGIKYKIPTPNLLELKRLFQNRIR